MRLSCGGIFNYCFVTNSPLSPMLKEFWKSVSVWQSYRQSRVAHLFSGHDVYFECSDSYPTTDTISCLYVHCLS